MGAERGFGDQVGRTVAQLWIWPRQRRGRRLKSLCERDEKEHEEDPEFIWRVGAEAGTICLVRRRASSGDSKEGRFGNGRVVVCAAK